MKVFYYSKIYEKYYFCLIIFFIVKIIKNKKYLKSFINIVYQLKITKNILFRKYFVLFFLFINFFVTFKYHAATAYFHTHLSSNYQQNRYISLLNFFSDRQFSTFIQEKT